VLRLKPGEPSRLSADVEPAVDRRPVRHEGFSARSYYSAIDDVVAAPAAGIT